LADLIRMMNEEGCRESGHLQINKIVLQDMTELAQSAPRLVQDSLSTMPNTTKCLPFIVELRNKGDKDISEIETCLNALYGIMLLKLQQKEISSDTEPMP
jgi:hypothetical protein